MATNALIALINKDGTGVTSHVHWDGFIEHTGALLLMHYQNPQKVQELLSLGNISFLAKEVHPTGAHSFDKPQEDVTVFYGRDRREDGCSPSPFSSMDELKSDAAEYPYAYAYKMTTGKWYFIDNDSKFRALQPLVRKLYSKMTLQIKTHYTTFLKNQGIEKQYIHLDNSIPVNEAPHKRVKL